MPQGTFHIGLLPTQAKRRIDHHCDVSRPISALLSKALGIPHDYVVDIPATAPPNPSFPPPSCSQKRPASSPPSSPSLRANKEKEGIPASNSIDSHAVHPPKIRKEQTCQNNMVKQKEADFSPQSHVPNKAIRVLCLVFEPNAVNCSSRRRNCDSLVSGASRRAFQVRVPRYEVATAIDLQGIQMSACIQDWAEQPSKDGRRWQTGADSKLTYPYAAKTTRQGGMQIIHQVVIQSPKWDVRAVRDSWCREATRRARHTWRLT
ncbi:hypothetical protein DFH07DRAFT_943898 [Mycena maculata]|uniref:Uncharacterized protein n=1 Tax=Mycena maculata TaxID=230809 RepID=A0AAD7ICH2_9AGAR|nr:hypothetical protein DFH07DRAFT_943898 [Mycena maculata]